MRTLGGFRLHWRRRSFRTSIAEYSKQRRVCTASANGLGRGCNRDIVVDSVIRGFVARRVVYRDALEVSPTLIVGLSNVGL